ncbi:C4-dicarboxylate transporter DcuC [Pectinatus frisingensis]|uniref:C4-dicarboxylate transporter DcuC n=1 Tax=Pectinatus frisingensis TaxID=865 RepID=UPI0018C76C54|nr:C4-dicarboxylate transporter DcuC [Pectinatus frisingensis]
MIIAGVVLIVLTFAAIVKNYETRLVLFISGIIMCFIGGDVGAGITSFINEFTNAGLVPTICTVLGFSYVMEYTTCSKHMVYLISSILKKCKVIMIPGAVLVTFFINIALPSAAGCAAAVGVLLIPSLIYSGVHPAMAASAVFLGTWGSVMSPGLMFNPQVAQLAGTDVMTVIGRFSLQVIIAAIAAAIILAIIAVVKKENSGYIINAAETKEVEEFHLNYLYAIIPILPLVLLIISSKQLHLIPYISVPVAMIIGTAIGFVVTRPNVKQATKQFFKGMGDGMGDVVGLIAAAACFTTGMTVIGITGALIDVMKNSQQIAQIVSAFGPFLIGALSGSGNAAALAFNGAITPHAADFGYGIIELGSMAQIGAGLGRCMSPVAGAGIIIAKMANINPLELTKRNAIPTIAATIIVMLLLL